MKVDESTILVGGLVVVVAVFLVGVGTCAGTDIVRDRHFEDACRKAGGYVGFVAQSGSDSRHEACYRNVSPPVNEPIPLPGYNP